MWWLGSPEFKVGFLVIAVSGLIAGMALKVANGPGIFGGKETYFFRAPNAGGLIQNSAVKMAGIKIGVIEDMVLEDGRAKIFVALKDDARLTKSARVELKADGILGDKHIEVMPGHEADEELRAGDEIPLGEGRGGMDDVVSDVSRVAKSLNELLDTLKKATREGDKTTSIGRIVGNIEKITTDLAEVTSENKDKIRTLLDRVNNIARNVDTYINEESLARVDRSLRNIEEITGKVNRGEGTLGRLINDEQTVEELNVAIQNVNKFLGGADKLETSVDFHTEFMGGDQNKSFLGIKLQPGLDRYYELDLISDTKGVTTRETSESTEDGVQHTASYKKTYKNNFKITALFAKNFWDFTIKGGLIENTGGVGFDYFIFGNRDLRLSNEFYHFQALQWRAFLRYNFFRGFYVIGGGDNLLSKDDSKAAGFVGAGIFLTNDDLKLLATKLSFK